MVNGIDISGWQEGINPSSTGSNFAIVKATGGTGFVNDDWRRQVEEALSHGLMVGIYHYAHEEGYYGSPQQEARFFLDTIRDYIGKVVPCLDWEANALTLPIAWAREWLEHVEQHTGSTPFFYSGGSYINNTDCSQIARFPLWKASYLSRYAGQGFQDDPVDVWPDGDWYGKKIYQYTSEGRLPGWGSNLDLNKGYFERNDWDRFIGNPAEQIPGDPINDNGIKYRAHVQDLGWCDWVRDGQVAGTTGHALRLEALQVQAPGWEIQCSAHLELLGWKKYGPGVEIGTVGEARRLEALGFDVLKRPNNGLSLEFQVHVEGYGWLPWTKEGYATGSVGQARRVEAVRLVLR